MGVADFMEIYSGAGHPNRTILSDVRWENHQTGSCSIAVFDYRMVLKLLTRNRESNMVVFCCFFVLAFKIFEAL